MQVSQYDNEIRLQFQYNQELVSKIKNIPGSCFHKDALKSYWTIPNASINIARRSKLFTEGNFYPGALNIIDFRRFEKLSIEVKADRIKACGPQNSLFDFLHNIRDLCSFEEKVQNTHEIRTLAKDIYFKNNILVVTFPKGLYSRVLKFLRVFKLQKLYVYPLTDAPKPSLNLNFANFTPRPYQSNVAREILNHEISNRQTLKMATGSGKTLLAALITANLKIPTIFYTYSRDLLVQTADVYEQALKQEVGCIGGNKFKIKPITIASIQTVHSCYEKQDNKWNKLAPYLSQVQCQFIDEGHGLGAETIYEVANITDAYYSYALTATPWREDGKEIFIEAASGPVIEPISEKELEDGGYILPIEVEMYPVKHYSTKKKSYRYMYGTQIIDHWERNRKIIKAVRKYDGKQVIILVKENAHGKKIQDVLNVPFIHGNTSSRERKEVLDQFREGKNKILIASSILKQGVDLPSCEVLVLAHGGSSLVELMQKVGRVRRPAPGESKGIVIDFYDQILPEVDGDIFKAQSERRLAFYRSKGFVIKKGEL
mgnify:CR=1 FL=1